MSSNTKLRPLEEADLEMLLRWRNSDQVRRYMFSTRPISEQEHRRWFEALRDDRSRHPLIFSHDGQPSGFVSFGPVRHGGISDWGFYVAPDSPRGTGRMLGDAAISYAFSRLHLHKVCGEVLSLNEASRRFHLSLGFREEGVLIEQHFDGAIYHDVVRFGLVAKDRIALDHEGA